MQVLSRISQRVFRCDNCGLEIDRDLNASINLEIAASMVVLACGLMSADTIRVKQEVSSQSVQSWVTLGKYYVTDNE
ncbi:MAG: transposase [Hormoscilla sp. GM7CHS1pb]|nr:transposase [Hormoscilla sp. GM7CHS1pb]